MEKVGRIHHEGRGYHKWKMGMQSWRRYNQYFHGRTDSDHWHSDLATRHRLTNTRINTKRRMIQKTDKIRTVLCQNCSLVLLISREHCDGISSLLDLEPSRPLARQLPENSEKCGLAAEWECLLPQYIQSETVPASERCSMCCLRVVPALVFQRKIEVSFLLRFERVDRQVSSRKKSSTYLGGVAFCVIRVGW